MADSGHTHQCGNCGSLICSPLMQIDPADEALVERMARACNPRRWDAYLRDFGSDCALLGMYRSYARKMLTEAALAPNLTDNASEEAVRAHNAALAGDPS